MKLVNNNIVNINNYSSAMRRLCLSGFRLVALFCCLVAPPFAVHNAHNQDERQLVERSSLIWHFSNKDCLLC
ncbi:hypothetical protein NP493_1444g01020 [Ridgeia piscesae]|uniref:Uncharacterized protein n=1 Tax=Ridgeia piscesae TaxID=27915 RepID=A0AAD9K3F3_RIDPI|nr:hypothetical protein NP493_1444g01020 [Ridgeia piscesae]